MARPKPVVYKLEVTLIDNGIYDRIDRKYIQYNKIEATKEIRRSFKELYFKSKDFKLTEIE